MVVALQPLKLYPVIIHLMLEQASAERQIRDARPVDLPRWYLLLQQQLVCQIPDIIKPIVRQGMLAQTVVDLMDRLYRLKGAVR